MVQVPVRPQPLSNPVLHELDGFKGSQDTNHIQGKFTSVYVYRFSTKKFDLVSTLILFLYDCSKYLTLL